MNPRTFAFSLTLILFQTGKIWAETETTWTKVSNALESRPLTPRQAGGTRFERIDSAESGIEFTNHLKEENIRNYLLNGAGLTLGDYDNDGFPDLFLVCQDGPNKLYRQRSPWKFEDVTVAAGILDQKAWGSGATFADMDNDGHLDLIVCNKGAPNEFYQNDGKGKFVGGLFTMAAPGTASPTIAAPCDYDRDGDLDLYIAANRIFDFREVVGHKIEVAQDATGKRRVLPPHDVHARFNEANLLIELGTPDLLVRNNGGRPGSPPMLGTVAYADSGMSAAPEHGLAAVWFDVNNDQWPDLYVSNDFSTPDHLYLNQGGTFRDVAGEMVAYTSFYSMGSDYADVNNDGHFDYFSTDMSSTTHYKQKTMMGAMEDSAWFLDHLEPRQQMRNVLHVNTGSGKFFATEYFSHLDSTDWTWSALFGDLDNDGFEDLYVTNGMERNVQNADLAQRTIQMNHQGVPQSEIQKTIRSAPRLAEKNLAFRNLGDLRFEDANSSWSLDQETVSHGSILADLDRDGDLDIIANGMNEPLLLLRNESGEGHAMLISLVGKKSNRFGLGARVTAGVGENRYTRIMTAVRGYASSTEPIVHLGLGDAQIIETLTIQWPSGSVQTLSDLKADQHYRITEPSDAPDKPNPPLGLPTPSPGAFFVELPSAETGLEFTHVENTVDDFANQPLLPNKLSQFGPALCSGDLNGDGLADLFVGGAAGSPGVIFLQNDDGSFLKSKTPMLTQDQLFEDVAALIFDADGDGDNDLFVASGGNHSAPDNALYQDRLYLNDGRAQLTSAPLPTLTGSAGAVAASDVDHDGDLDLFVGSRFTPQNYPLAPGSHLLLNDGKGHFTPSLEIKGMITGARFGDLDGDSWEDLVISQEWGPVSIWKNVQGTLTNIDDTTGLADLTGWWNGLEVGDIDGDGDPDLVATNFGLNNKYHATREGPAMLLAADFGDGKMNLVEAIHEEGKLFPVRGKSCSTQAMPFLAKKFPTFHDFALADIDQIYEPGKRKDLLKLSATTLESHVIMNNGDGTFTPMPLPGLAQLAPSFGAVLHDFDGDGNPDLVLAQNFFHPQRETGRMNASLNLLLKGDGRGGFSPVWPVDSGLNSRDDSRNVLILPRENSHLLVFAPNNGPLRSFRILNHQ